MITSEEVEKYREINVVRLDNYIERRCLDKIGFIKIDTEGYEYFVLKGLEKYFSSNSNLPPILCEITPKACSVLGNYTIKDIFDYMARYSYLSVHVDNLNFIVKPEDLVNKTNNVIFIQNHK